MAWLDWLSADSVGVPEHAPPPDQLRQLVLYKYDTCPYCVRVIRIVEQLELKLEYRDTIRDRGVREELRSATGRGTVPCLFIDGQPLFESADIVAWLQAYSEQVPHAPRG